MSHGEIFVLEHAGFSSDEIFYIGNNVSADELRYCIDRGYSSAPTRSPSWRASTHQSRRACRPPLQPRDWRRPL
ncbi:MAG: hypothetical protein ACLUEQ_01265 [Cloacibacillus evryensis]